LLVAATRLFAQQVAVERRRRALAEQWPDLLAILRSRLAAGRALPQATVEAALHTGQEMESIGRELERSLAQGLPFAEALERRRKDLADPIADRVLTSLAFAARAGGGRVADILGMLGQSVGDELRLRRAHDAALTQQRLTAGVALAAPWGLLVLTVVTNPQAAAAYGTSSGMKVVGLGLAMTGAGFLLARRSARLARPARVFR
jgi:tight adherence protein B